MSSDTPRTDAARPPFIELQDFVSADFARTLERELAKANRILDNSVARPVFEQVVADNAALRAALADCAGWMAAQIAVQRSRVWTVEIYPTGAWKELVRCEEQARAALGKEASK